MSLGYFILDQRLNFSRSWTILRIQLKVYGNVHVLQNTSTFGILSFLWLGGVTEHPRPIHGSEPPLWPFIWTR